MRLYILYYIEFTANNYTYF